MALNIPMPGLPGDSFLKGIDTGSSMFSRLIQPVIDRERLNQQQQQFAQDYALKKQAQDKSNTLLPYMIQQYQDTHRTAAGEAQMKELYRGLLQDALKGAGSPTSTTSTSSLPVTTPQMGGGQPSPTPGGMIPQPGGMAPQASGAAPQAVGMSDQVGGASDQVGGSPANGQASGLPVLPPMGQSTPNQDITGQEHELRAGNPRLIKLDSVAGLVPGIPKPVQHIANGMIITTYPSGRMTVQQPNLPGMKTSGEKNVSAKEESKLRDQATSLINSANLVQQGYDILDDNPDLTGPGTFVSEIPIPFTGSKINLSNNSELGKFKTVTGKLQAELGKYASSRGGIQAVNWAGSVKPSASNPQDYNYGMFDGIQRNINDDYNTLNQQYKAVTGRDLPVSLPNMKTTRGKKGTPGATGTPGKKVTKVWKLVNGQLV